MGAVRPRRHPRARVEHALHRSARGRRRRLHAPMGYFDWHEQPGYWRDVTRHFAPDTTLLDVGCGSAWLAEHFADYTGVDGSPDAVEAAAARGRRVLLADADEPLPFE